MKNSLFLQNAFAKTTVDVEQVYSFLRQGPNTLKSHFACRASTREVDLTGNVSYCMVVFRMYLRDTLSTPDYVYDEIGSFLQFEPQAAPALLQEALELLKQHILIEEWYELMPRYLLARQRINELFNL